MKDWLTLDFKFGNLKVWKKYFPFAVVFLCGMFFQSLLSGILAKTFLRFDGYFSDHVVNFMAISLFKAFLWGLLFGLAIWMSVDIAKIIKNKKAGRKKAPRRRNARD